MKWKIYSMSTEVRRIYGFMNELALFSGVCFLFCIWSCSGKYTQTSLIMNLENAAGSTKVVSEQKLDLLCVLNQLHND